MEGVGRGPKVRSGYGGKKKRRGCKRGRGVSRGVEVLGSRGRNGVRGNGVGGGQFQGGRMGMRKRGKRR